MKFGLKKPQQHVVSVQVMKPKWYGTVLKFFWGGGVGEVLWTRFGNGNTPVPICTLPLQWKDNLFGGKYTDLEGNFSLEQDEIYNRYRANFVSLKNSLV